MINAIWSRKAGIATRVHAICCTPAILISVLFMLAACAPVQTTQDKPATPTSARIKAEQGDHVAASREYLDLALASQGTQRQRYLIFAAGELFIANDLDSANRILDDIGANVDEQNLDVWAEVTALLKLSEGEPQAALNALNQVSKTTNAGAAVRIMRLRAQALFELNRPEAAVATLIQRETLLRNSTDIENNHRLIWSGLQQSGASISPDTARAGDPVLEGWLELGYIAYSRRGSLNSLSAGIEDWRLQNPEHPANSALLDEVLASVGAFSGYPQNVAVMLPLTGKQQALGEAIRDGYLAAHFALGQDAERPSINFYDTAKSGATATYQQAIFAGADFVVGPLLKNEIMAVADLSDGAGATTLALNYAPDDANLPVGFYQFALAPEDEAREVAIRATQEGRFNAVALVPDSDWGKRVLQAFREELEGRGGKLLSARRYPNDAPDYSMAIRQILLLDESYARRERLAANIGKKLEFEPRRRQDVDLIFVAANAATAKLIKPQLQFHYAGEIPTFTTSAVYQPGSKDNADINGIVFPDIPWLLEPSQSVVDAQMVLNQYWGSGMDRLARFYAMGYDAYQLSAILNGRTDTNAPPINGMTGRLSMDGDGRLHRELRWARMERGQPRLLPDVVQSLSQDAEVEISSLQ